MSDGIHHKYNVTRSDGSSNKGGKHEKCRYFVLDLDHDENAPLALMAYAKLVRKTNPELARDLEKIAGTKPLRCGCREASCPHSLLRAITPQTPGDTAGELMADAWGEEHGRR